MKTLSKIASAGALLGNAFFFASATFAQSASGYISGISPVFGGNLLAFIKSALNTIIALAALVAVGILVYSGIQYILASGDDNKIEKATKGITYAIIGLVICFISMLIVQFVLTNLLKVS